MYKNAKGEVQFVKTGDKLIDKWEQELADGKIPDYMEGFSGEQLKKLRNLREFGTDQFNKRMSGALTGPPKTLLDTSHTVVEDAVRQGLGRPISRFNNLDSPE